MHSRDLFRAFPPAPASAISMRWRSRSMPLRREIRMAQASSPADPAPASPVLALAQTAQTDPSHVAVDAAAELRAQTSKRCRDDIASRPSAPSESRPLLIARIPGLSSSRALPERTPRAHRRWGKFRRGTKRPRTAVAGRQCCISGAGNCCRLVSGKKLLTQRRKGREERKEGLGSIDCVL